MRVLCEPRLWNGFLRRCKDNFPEEHIEAIHGRETEDAYIIEAFYKMDFDASESTADYTGLEVARQRCVASKRGRLFLGTVHSHPSSDYDSAPSSSDHISGHTDGEKIIGIVQMSLKKGKTKRFIVDAKWWVPQKPLEFVLTLPNVQEPQPAAAVQA